MTRIEEEARLFLQRQQHRTDSMPSDIKHDEQDDEFPRTMSTTTTTTVARNHPNMEINHQAGPSTSSRSLPLLPAKWHHFSGPDTIASTGPVTGRVCGSSQVDYGTTFHGDNDNDNGVIRMGYDDDFIHNSDIDTNHLTATLQLQPPPRSATHETSLSAGLLSQQYLSSDTNMQRGHGIHSYGGNTNIHSLVGAGNVVPMDSNKIQKEIDVALVAGVLTGSTFTTKKIGDFGTHNKSLVENFPKFEVNPEFRDEIFAYQQKLARYELYFVVIYGYIWLYTS